MKLKFPDPYSKTWLWKLAVFFLMLGAAMYFILPLVAEASSLEEPRRVIIWATFLSTGLCAIIATSNWWLKK